MQQSYRREATALGIGCNLQPAFGRCKSDSDTCDTHSRLPFLSEQTRCAECGSVGTQSVVGGLVGSCHTQGGYAAASGITELTLKPLPHHRSAPVGLNVRVTDLKNTDRSFVVVQRCERAAEYTPVVAIHGYEVGIGVDVVESLGVCDSRCE